MGKRTAPRTRAGHGATERPRCLLAFAGGTRSWIFFLLRLEPRPCQLLWRFLKRVTKNFQTRLQEEAKAPRLHSLWPGAPILRWQEGHQRLKPRNKGAGSRGDRSVLSFHEWPRADGAQQLSPLPHETRRTQLASSVWLRPR